MKCRKSLNDSVREARNIYLSVGLEIDYMLGNLSNRISMSDLDIEIQATRDAILKAVAQSPETSVTSLLDLMLTLIVERHLAMARHIPDAAEHYAHLSPAPVS